MELPLEALRSRLLPEDIGVDAPEVLLVDDGGVLAELGPEAVALDGAPAPAGDDGWSPEVLDTLGVLAPLDALAVSGALELLEALGLPDAAPPLEALGLVVAAGPDAGALLAVDDDGGVLNELDAGGTLGSPDDVPGGVAAVDGVLLSDGAVVTGGAGVSTRVSLLHAAIDVPMATALTAIRNLRVDIVCSGLVRVSGWERPRDMRGA